MFGRSYGGISHRSGPVLNKAGEQASPRRNDIQGLRGVAVLSVLLFHAFPKAFPGGFVGVDIFFVISGYLITGIVYRATVAGNFSYADFYRRRVRRIFPALFAMLIPTSALGLVLLSPEELYALGGSMIAALVSISNIYFWRTSGYFATEADLKPLLHTWSLGVEEQFYIFLPALITLLVRFARSHDAIVIAIGFVGSLVLSQIVLGMSESASYFLLPTRAFELLAGSFLAVVRVLQCRTPALRNVVFLTGMALIVAPIFLFSAGTPFPGLNALFPTLGAAFVLHAGSGAGAQDAFSSRVMSNWICMFFGDISYSLYLWHWPILAYLRIIHGTDLPVHLGAGALLLATALAYASFRFIEAPIMRLPIGQGRNGGLPFLRAGALAIIAGTLALAPILLTKGLPNRFSHHTLALFASADDHNPLRSQCHDNGNAAPIPYAKNCVFGDHRSGHVIAVWGDSHGAELAYVLGAQSALLKHDVMEITMSRCPPALAFVPRKRPLCVAHNAATLEALVADPRVDTVVLAANGIGYMGNSAGFFAGFEAAMNRLHAAGKKLFLVSQLPVHKADPPVTLGYASINHENLGLLGESVADYTARSRAWNTELGRLANKYDARLMSAQEELCGPSLCPMYRDGQALYFNRGHVSLQGAKLIVRDYRSELSKTSM